ncbi:hypothetical protein GN299_31080 [Pseudomonas putida]|uniref:Serine protease n=2 Tax=Pseudomonas TaxID=286 RepID=A0A7V8EA37_PSEPU|nr:hypothetical protein GN299_31080 [Pseudomonas putida]
MFRGLISFAAALTAMPALGEPYFEAGPAVIQLHVYGTLKQPLPNEQSVDFHERGTGFVASPDGLVLSAGHNIPDKSLFDEDGFFIEGYFPAKDQDALSAVDPPVELEVITATQSPYDVSLLRIKDSDTVRPFLRLCDNYKRAGNFDFVVLGYQGGDRILTSNYGPVMAGAGATSNILVQIPLNKGNSGGPIFNELGMVFGIAIGEKTVGSERMQSTSIAVPMSKVMQTLGDASKPLAGVSYDPDCGKQLKPQFTALIESPIKVGREPRPVAAEVITTETIDYSKVVKEIPPPTGYKVVTYKSITVDQPGVKTEIFVPKDGSKIFVKGTSKEPKLPTSVNANIEVLLEPTSPENAAPSFRVQTFPYSKTLDTHNIEITSKDFKDTIPAPDGFVFKEFLKIDYVSLNHSPSKGANVQISPDGKALLVSYSLQSGPIYDQWRGWIDAFITAKLEPKP